MFLAPHGRWRMSHQIEALNYRVEAGRHLAGVEVTIIGDSTDVVARWDDSSHRGDTRIDAHWWGGRHIGWRRREVDHLVEAQVDRMLEAELKLEGSALCTLCLGQSPAWGLDNVFRHSSKHDSKMQSGLDKRTFVCNGTSWQRLALPACLLRTSEDMQGCVHKPMQRAWAGMQA